ncbi:MAG: DUF2232 domain-containing protein [Candidatus Eremiobacteraeota bacterium]|nr:DUF2232 domain-containing protein [Candidatus Eremiobacteraeota bacterium]
MDIFLEERTRRRNFTKNIALGGILTGIAVIFTIVGNLFAFLDILQFLAVTPLIIAGASRGLAFSAKVTAASTILVGIIYGFFPAGLFFFLANGPLGLALGCLFREKAGPKAIVLTTMALIALNIVLVIFIGIKFMGIHLEKELVETAAYFHMEGSRLIRQFYLFCPSLLFFAALAYAFYIWLFNTYLLKKMKLSSEKPLFHDYLEIMDFPRYFIIIVTGSLLVLLLSSTLKSGLVHFIALNVTCIFCILFFFKGVFFINSSMPGRLHWSLRIVLFLFSVTVGIPVIVLSGIVATMLPRGRPAPL